MATSGGPLCILVYLVSLIASSNNLKIAYHAMYAVSVFLPMTVIAIRLKMIDSLLFRKSNFKHNRIPVWLIIRRYWLRLLGTSSAFFLYDFINL
jgi:hypothetical protein